MEWSPDPSLYEAYLRRKIARGRGCGSGAAYLPWYTTREIPSKGTSDTPTSIRLGRRFELLSEYETLYFHLLERRPVVVDVREQFPILEIAETLRLAAQFGLPHKRKGRFPEPYTIDFLVTELIGGRQVHRAASIKPPDFELDGADAAKLHIEQAWCRSRGIEWAQIDMSPEQVPSPHTTLQVLRFLRAWHRNNWTADEELQRLVIKHFKFVYRQNVRLADLLEQTAKRLRVPTTQVDDAFRYAAWVNDIRVSLHHPIALNRPLVLKHDEV